MTQEDIVLIPVAMVLAFGVLIAISEVYRLVFDARPTGRNG